MDKIFVKGGEVLRGTVHISGAKNAALPTMAASLLTEDQIILRNLPQVRDIETTGKLLQEMGCEAELDQISKNHMCILRAKDPIACEAPYELVKTMRASVLVLGPLLARLGQANVSLPGGCAIGARPIDLHIEGLKKLGATISIEHGYVKARADQLIGSKVVFDQITVTGTENLIMAASLAKGETILLNAACEPEVINLANMLRSMGALIEGDGTKTIRINGVSNLNGADHTIIPDRIEAGTFMIAGAITGGEIELIGCQPCHLSTVINTMRQAGVIVEETERNSCIVRAPHEIQACNVITKEYPGFATDMQAQFMGLMTQAHGTSIITETVFESRFLHASEMIRMGANIKIEGNQATIFGKTSLTGANVIASDLRASASLVLAGLVATGETIIDRVYHLDRGYERIEHKLKNLGAKIIRGSK